MVQLWKERQYFLNWQVKNRNLRGIQIILIVHKTKMNKHFKLKSLQTYKKKKINLQEKQQLIQFQRIS